MHGEPGVRGIPMKSFILIVLTLSSNLVFSYDASITNNTILVKEKDILVYEIPLTEDAIKASPGMILEAPRVYMAGSCLLLTYGSTSFGADSGKSDISYPGKVDMYDIKNKKYVSTIPDFTIYNIAYLNKGDKWKEEAFIVSFESETLDGYQFVGNGCKMRKGLETIPMSHPMVTTYRNHLIIDGYCKEQGKSCLLKVFTNSKNIIDSKLYLESEVK